MKRVLLDQGLAPQAAVILRAESRDAHPCDGGAGEYGALTGYDFRIILKSMKIGERGQVTIPKGIREQFGLGPETEVEFRVVGGSIVLRKAPKKLNLAKWRGRCGNTFAKMGYSSVDTFIDDVRGR
jgi:AbrB family looped-hinge helix DNA binding protein